MRDTLIPEQQATHVVSALKTSARGAALLAILMGCLVLLERVAFFPLFANVRAGLRMVDSNTALAFALSGLCLWLRCAEQIPSRARRFADACAFASLLIGLFTLLQYALTRNVGSDPILFRRPTGLSGILSSERMALAGAALFAAFGLALLFLDVEDRRGRRPAQPLAVLVGLFALAALFGYLFDVIAPRQGIPYSSLPWPTSLTFLLLSLGALCARPDRGLMRGLTAGAVGGVVARRLLPAAVMVPPLLCILCYLGYYAKWYDAGFGLAVLTTLNSAVFTILIWRTAEALNQTDEQRRRAEVQRNELNAALQEANAFREKVMDSAVFAVVALDREGRFTLVNRRMTEITGYAVEDLGGQPYTMLLPDESRELVVERLQRTLHEGAPVRTETPLVRKDGSMVSVVYGWSALFSEGKVIGVVGVGEDITERKRLEDQLLQAQKLESVGRLAGGVAHDFNNLLTVILGYTEIALEEGQLQAREREYLANIQQAAEKASNLTRQLLAFARRQVIEPKVVNINDLVLNLDKMLRRLISENIELIMLLDEGLHSVRVDPGQFEQILVNLVVNARDALPDGGKITIETYNTILDAAYVQEHGEVIPGEYVLLTVSDTGSGMEEAVRLHIFEPFFTTKEKGRGTGLGLATVYGIVRQAGGHIWLYSEQGAGTTFKIYLPRVADFAEAVVALRPPRTLSQGTETVLVVEDEASVRTLTTSALRQLGYRVLEADNGESALQVHTEYAGDIALLITDVVMPRMSGKELSERLQREHPALKVLFVSGYTQNTIVHHGALDPGINFLPKPFTPAELSAKVREVLDGES